MDVQSEIYPLANASRKNLAKICEVLWGWTPCAQWISRKICQQRLQLFGCPCQRAAKLEPFFDYYRDVAAYYIPELISNKYPALRSHDDLVDIIALLKKDTQQPRSKLTTEYFNQRVREGFPRPPITDQNRAFSLAVRIIGMIQCSVENQFDGLLETGLQPAIWHSERPFKDFLDSVFPRREWPSLDPDGDVAVPAKVDLACVTAKRLMKVAHLKIIPTDDLRNHLLLNHKEGTLAIYHYTSVLKEHILAGKERDSEEGLIGPIPGENIPEELALETLDTLHDVLFPIDTESQLLLRSLVTKNKLDPDILRLDTSFYRQQSEQRTRYPYWGSRLIDLHDELVNPTPRGFFERWVERKSGPRYVMIATLAGVAIAVVLGIFSLAVSIFQAWVGWQQWKHPVIGNDSRTHPTSFNR